MEPRPMILLNKSIGFENNVLNVGLHYTHFLSRIKAFTMP